VRRQRGRRGRACRPACRRRRGGLAARAARHYHGSTIDVELDTLLDQGGMTRSDIDLKNVSYADRMSAIGNGSIDLAFTFDSAVARPEQGNPPPLGNA